MRTKATKHGKVRLTAAQELQRDAEDAAYAARPVKTRADIAEERVTAQRELNGLVKALAARFSVTERELLDEIRANVPGGSETPSLR